MLRLFILLEPDGQRGTVSQECPKGNHAEFVGSTQIMLKGVPVSITLYVKLPDPSWEGATLSADTLCRALLPAEGGA